MEKTVMFADKSNHPEKMPVFQLAYIGDAVYELAVREALVAEGFSKPKDIHREAVRYVNARTQSRMLKLLEPRLTPAEADLVRRARNAKTGHIPKSADMIEYRYSTALEALIGYLYIKEEKERLNEIFLLLRESHREIMEEIPE